MRSRSILPTVVVVAIAAVSGVTASPAAAKVRQCRGVDTGAQFVFRADKLRASKKVSCAATRHVASLMARGNQPGSTDLGTGVAAGYGGKMFLCRWPGSLATPTTTFRCSQLRPGTATKVDKRKGGMAFRLVNKTAG